MGALQLANLIKRHEGNPKVWTDTIFGGNTNENFGPRHIADLEQAFAISTTSDRLQTINNLRGALSNHELRMVAYMQVNGRSANEYQIWSAEQGRQFLIALIEAMQP